MTFCLIVNKLKSILVKVYVENVFKSVKFGDIHIYYNKNFEITTFTMANNGEVKRASAEERVNESKRLRTDPEQNSETKQVRVKLGKFVLLLSYSGKGYLGMQRNPGFKTIEEDLIQALLKANLITAENAASPKSFHFQRAARTDKGVSAARQIVSMKLPDRSDHVEIINPHLPETIRVMKSVKVTQKFDSKNKCDSRSYSYMTPTFVFAPLEKFVNEEYRISPEILEKVRSILARYIGTHRFHNFTARVKAEEMTCQRYIMNIECSDPFFRSGIEWVKIHIKGQSFMLHQIRKMVGLCIAICRGFVQEDVFDLVWQKERCDVPIAPSLGLVLEQPHYEYYNKKFLNDGIHEQLSWECVEADIAAFREKHIDSEIAAGEVRDKVTLNWLQTLFIHSFGQRKDGPPDSNDPMGIYHARKLIKEAREENLSNSTENGTNEDTSNTIPSEDIKSQPVSKSIDVNISKSDSDDQKVSPHVIENNLTNKDS